MRRKSVKYAMNLSTQQAKKMNSKNSSEFINKLPKTAPVDLEQSGLEYADQ